MNLVCVFLFFFFSVRRVHNQNLQIFAFSRLARLIGFCPNRIHPPSSQVAKLEKTHTTIAFGFFLLSAHCVHPCVRIHPPTCSTTSKTTPCEIPQNPQRGVFRQSTFRGGERGSSRAEGFRLRKKNRKKIKKKLFFIQFFFSSNTVGSPRGSQPKVGRLEKKVKKHFFIFFSKFSPHIFFHFFFFLKTWKTHFPISRTPEFAPFGTPK